MLTCLRSSSKWGSHDSNVSRQPTVKCFIMNIVFHPSCEISCSSCEIRFYCYRQTILLWVTHSYVMFINRPQIIFLNQLSFVEPLKPPTKFPNLLLLLLFLLFLFFSLMDIGWDSFTCSQKLLVPSGTAIQLYFTAFQAIIWDAF